MKSFSQFHPFILFIYYVTVLGITIFMMHPIVLVISLLSALLFFGCLTSLKTIAREISFYTCVFILIAVTNPLFVHKGETILFFLNERPVTLEAIIYGIFIATMLVAVIFWSKSYSYLMGSEKVIYLFGKIVPKLSLIITITLRLIPLFKKQIQKVNRSQKTLGLYTSDSVTDRLLSGVRLFNSILTWSLEHAIHQADAMKARGYGLRKRTHFSLFTWTLRDTIMLVLIISLLSITIYIYGSGSIQFFYYPSITPLSLDLPYISQFIFIFILMMLPSLIEIKENLYWIYLKSSI